MICREEIRTHEYLLPSSYPLQLFQVVSDLAFTIQHIVSSWTSSETTSLCRGFGGPSGFGFLRHSPARWYLGAWCLAAPPVLRDIYYNHRVVPIMLPDVDPIKLKEASSGRLKNTSEDELDVYVRPSRLPARHFPLLVPYPLPEYRTYNTYSTNNRWANEHQRATKELWWTDYIWPWFRRASEICSAIAISKWRQDKLCAAFCVLIFFVNDETVEMRFQAEVARELYRRSNKRKVENNGDINLDRQSEREDTFN